MKKIKRRSFIKKVIKSSSAAIILGGHRPAQGSTGNNNQTTDNMEVFIPMPVQVVIDDVGWWSGEDGSKRQEPYRTGINRNHVPADYQAIADLGRMLGIRPQAAFILCEWDKENILSKAPTSTWMGNKWDNTKWIGPWLDEAAEIIRNNRKYFEITIHGVGHEYWEGGTFSRAEWTDSKGQMRPKEQVELHLEYFEKLMNQHNLGPLPNSFVPTAFRHSFGPSKGQNISLAEILEQKGVTYINTPFSSMYNKERAQYKYFGLDSNVITIDRGEDEFPWLTFPAHPVAELSRPTCGLHWPNLLHPDPQRNYEVVKDWVDYLKLYNHKKNMMLAPDSLVFRHQLVHYSLTTTQLKRNSIELNFIQTDKLPLNVVGDGLTIKIMTEKPREFSSDNIKIKSLSLHKKDYFLYTLRLDRIARKERAEIKIS